MSKIKSALELALERTADVKIDKDAVRKDEWIRKGKTTAAGYLRNPGKNSLEGCLHEGTDEEKAWKKEGILDTLLVNLTLPRVEQDIEKLTPLKQALAALIRESGGDESNLDYLMNHCAELFKQYLGHLDQLEDALKTQWEPRLRQKEAQLQRKTGHAVKLTPEQDPEFSKVFSEELQRLDAQFSEVLIQGKVEIRKMLG